MDYDERIDEKIKLVEDEKNILMARLRYGVITPQLEAQLGAIYEYGNALSYQRQRQAMLDRAKEQLAEAADQARETHQAYMKAANS